MALARDRGRGLSRVLLVDVWHHGSHQAWAEGLRAHSRHDVHLVVGSAQRWRWQQSAGVVGLKKRLDEALTRHRPQVIIATSPLDVSRLRGLCRLGEAPVVAYQHESQVCYPSTANEATSRAAALTDWLSWIAADEVWFNSDFHRHRVLERLPGFVRGLDDPAHSALLEPVLARTRTVPLGLDLAALAPSRDSAEPDSPTARRPVIVWPHRWEPDKDPEAFDRALARLERRGLDFGLVLAGAVPAEGPDRRRRLAGARGERVVACGPFGPSSYRAWLGRADLVVSCARHEFFGVGVAEAVAAGCQPVVPFGLAYQEVLGDTTLGYPPGRFGSALLLAVEAWHDGVRPPESLADGVRRFAWPEVIGCYDQAIDDLVASSPADRRR